MFEYLLKKYCCKHFENCKNKNTTKIIPFHSRASEMASQDPMHKSCPRENCLLLETMPLRCLTLKFSVVEAFYYIYLAKEYRKEIVLKMWIIALIVLIYCQGKGNSLKLKFKALTKFLSNFFAYKFLICCIDFQFVF